MYTPLFPLTPDYSDLKCFKVFNGIIIRTRFLNKEFDESFSCHVCCLNVKIQKSAVLFQLLIH